MRDENEEGALCTWNSEERMTSDFAFPNWYPEVDMARPAGNPEDVTVAHGETVASSSAVPPIVRIAQRLGQLIPDDELRQIPRDLSDQVDHYVYGTPKR